MSIISAQFAAFVAVVFVLYSAWPARRRWLLLLAASLFFYAGFGLRGLLILAASTLADYGLARLLSRSTSPTQRRFYLGTSLAVNLGSLALFKYSIPALLSLNPAPEWQAFVWGLHMISAPLGLSFFTFAKLGYIIDVYRGKTPAETHLGYFAAFVSFFPNLAAGPIERAGHLLPQLRAWPGFDAARVECGLRRVLWGVFKKVVIADRLAIYVDAVYNQPWAVSGQATLLATFFLAFQIYADFSAYTDIAIGVAQMLGLELFENFRQPYFATSPSDFWRRWHMSLTNWIREYLLFPLVRPLLAKSRGRMSPLLVQAAVYLLVMALVGLWHGADLSFVVWGLLHGVYLTVELLLPPRFRQAAPNRAEAIGRAVVTFGLVDLAWILFRANNLTEAVYIFTHLFSFSGDLGAGLVRVLPLDPAMTALFQVLQLDTTAYDALRLAQVLLSLGLVGLLLLVDLAEARGGFMPKVVQAPAWLRWGVYYAATAAILVLGVWGLQEFIYFRF